MSRITEDFTELEILVADMDDFRPKGSFPLFVDALLSDTRGWDDDLRFKYVRLLEHLYHQGGYVDDDLAIIAEVSGINRARNWREKAEKLRCILVSSDEKSGFLTNKRVLKEVVRSFNQKAKSASGGRKKAQKTAASGTTSGIAPPPTPIKDKEKEKKERAGEDHSLPNDQDDEGMRSVLVEKLCGVKFCRHADAPTFIDGWIEAGADPGELEEIIKNAVVMAHTIDNVRDRVSDLLRNTGATGETGFDSWSKATKIMAARSVVNSSTLPKWVSADDRRKLVRDGYLERGSNSQYQIPKPSAA